MRRVLAVLLVVTCLVALAPPAAHAGGHGAARVAIGLATFAIFAPFIIAGEILSLALPPYRAPAVVVAPPPAYYAPAPAYSAPPPAYYAPAPAYSGPPPPHRPAHSSGGTRAPHRPVSRQGGLMLNPGDKAPDFTGRDHNGNPVKLSDFKGKTVVLWFYPKADTPG